MSLSAKTSFGRYEIIHLLGVGGMGEVHIAQDTTLDRQVAIKFLAEKFSTDADRLNRFVQEAKSASALNHPNILTVYEIGQTDDKHFIATEFIDGKTLNRYFAEETIPLQTILDIAVQIASALQAAHQAGIVHRNIKPDNIMIRADGIVKLLDFGLVKLTEKPNEPILETDAATVAKVMTAPGIVMGTPQYMSPEQARGKETDSRSDIWSVGVVLYEILSGSVPFQGETMNDVIAAIIHKETPPLTRFVPNCPPELERIVMKTLQKNKDERYQTIKDFVIDLKSFKRRLAYEVELERNATFDRNTFGTNPTLNIPFSSSVSRHSAGNKDYLLLTEFVNLTGDPVFDDTLKMALTDALEQSPFLDIFPWLPTINAALKLQLEMPKTVVKELETARKYEKAAEFYPQYLRGLAYLQLKQNRKAEAEFQKILDNRGESPLSALYPLAQLGKARATKNKADYEFFFEIWKDADKDMPALVEAEKELA